MKVTAIETVRLDAFPNILWTQVRTDEGVTGLGETFYGSHAAEAHVHQTIAPYLIGKDPRNIERHQLHLTGYVGFTGASAESRGRSAIDIALWDLLAKSVNLPLADLLGGRVRDSIRVYNTCAGYSYVQTRPTQGTDNFGLNAKKGQYEDLQGFLERADEVALSLLDMGIDAMKIWPFDYAAEASQGQWLSSADMKRALEPFEKIRRAVGDRIDVMCELHGLWNRPQAVKIARALEPFEPMWVEDPVMMDHMEADFKYLLDLNALSLVIMDVAWCGGVSEARKIAATAQTYKVPVAFHDCTGPVALATSTHLALHVPNCPIQEMVRAFYYGWYGDMTMGLPPVKDGRISINETPGHGVSLHPDLDTRGGVHRRTTTAKDL
jgi:L-alanine-DL-glutamate epimerase-like enolase superfamily enzyme